MNKSTGYLNYVSALLRDQEVVFIPGFGAFVAKYKPAKANNQSGIIYPPTKYIAFNEQLNIHDSTFAQYLDEQTETHYSLRLYDQFVNQLKQDLKNHLVIVVPQVGRVFRDYEGVTHFMPDLDNLNSDIFGLPQLNYKPLFKSQVRALNGSKGLVSGRRPLLAAAASLFFLIFITWFAYINWMPGSNNLAGNGSVDTTTEMSILEGIKAEGSPALNAPSDVAKPAIEPDVDDSMPEEANSNVSVVEDANKFEAIIIVGAFGNSSNANNMKSKVKELGYEVYDDRPKKLERIGIILKYDSQQNLDKKLQTIRKEIAARAWILE